MALAGLVVALLGGALVAYHRLLFRQHEKESLVRVTNVLAIAGLITVGLAVSGAVLLVVSFVAPGAPAVVITVFAGVSFAGLWFVLPLSHRAGQDQPPGPTLGLGESRDIPDELARRAAGASRPGPRQLERIQCNDVVLAASTMEIGGRPVARPP